MSQEEINALKAREEAQQKAKQEALREVRDRALAETERQSTNKSELQEKKRQEMRQQHEKPVTAKAFGKIYYYNSWGYRRAENKFTIKTQDAIKKYTAFTGKPFTISSADDRLCIVGDFYVFDIEPHDKMYRDCWGIGINGKTGKAFELTIITK